MIGLGFSSKGFAAGMASGPDMIGCDAGTADTGPGPLGTGKPPKGRQSMERDLRIMLKAARDAHIPMIIGSCGGAGADEHLEITRGIVQDIAQAEGLHFRLALVYAEQDHADMHSALDENRIRALGSVPRLTHTAIDASSHIVAMMGAGPLQDALDDEADVILAGRCADPAIFASYALRAGVAAGPSWHAAKCIDKGPLATTEPGRGSPVLATVDDEGFSVEPALLDARCTIQSVAGITLHENPDPWLVAQPSGSIDTRKVVYQALDSRRVRVVGSQFQDAVADSVKLEGARLVGYRSILIAGIRDPRLLAVMDDFLEAFRAILIRVARSLRIEPEAYTLQFRTFGKDAVMGALEPNPVADGHEVGLIVDVVAEDQETAYTLASRAGPTGSRLDFTGKLGGGGNFAYPFSLPVVSMGPVYEWSVWHLLDTDERSPFRRQMVNV
jgi:hypothetical protein